MPPCTADQDRHLAWVRRDDEPHDKETGRAPILAWRAKPIYRKGAKKVLVDWDNQIRQSTPLSGRIYYKPDPALPMWNNWRTWPHLGMSHDLGSDCLCASHAGERKWQLNFSKFNDLDHGCQRALVDCLKSSGLYDFWLLMMVSWNLPNGPDNNDYRYAQIVAAIEHLQKIHTARSCVIGLPAAIMNRWEQTQTAKPIVNNAIQHKTSQYNRPAYNKCKRFNLAL